MIVFFKPSFIKDLNALPNEPRIAIEKICKEIFRTADSLKDIPYPIKNITDFPHYYRLRFREYRIGFKKEKDVIIFMRVKHRKDIYRRFP